MKRKSILIILVAIMGFVLSDIYAQGKKDKFQMVYYREDSIGLTKDIDFQTVRKGIPENHKHNGFLMDNNVKYLDLF